SIAEIVADAGAAAPFDTVLKASDTDLMKEVLAALSPREQEILALRFGLNDDTSRTLEEVGQRFGVTRERIRQIQNEALTKLRAKMEKRYRPTAKAIVALAE